MGEPHQDQPQQAYELTESELAWIRANYPDLEDAPAAVLSNVGAYDTDCAGGCG